MISNCSLYKLDNLQIYTSAIRSEQMNITMSYHKLNTSITVTVSDGSSESRKVVFGNKTEIA